MLDAIVPPKRICIARWTCPQTIRSTCGFSAITDLKRSRPPKPPRSISGMPVGKGGWCSATIVGRSEEHTSELQSLMRISYAVFCLNKKTYELEQHHTDP